MITEGLALLFALGGCATCVMMMLNWQRLPPAVLAAGGDCALR
jgi:hypothetical protein